MAAAPPAGTPAATTPERSAGATLLAAGPDWQLVHCPTHREHFYDVHRLEFAHSMDVATEGSCHVLSLVEGQQVLLETANGARQRFNYAETFVVPAAAERYHLVSESGAPVRRA